MDTSPSARNERCRTYSTRKNQFQRILVGWGATKWIPDWTRLAIRTWCSYSYCMISHTCIFSLLNGWSTVPVLVPSTKIEVCIMCDLSRISVPGIASKQAGCREREVGHDSRAKDVPSITMPTLSKTVALLLLVQPATSSLLPTTDLLAQANVAVSSTDAIACACQRHEPTTTLVTNAFLITFLLLVNRGR